MNLHETDMYDFSFLQVNSHIKSEAFDLLSIHPYNKVLIMPVHKIAIIQLESKVILSQVSCHRRASNTRDKKENPVFLI